MKFVEYVILNNLGSVESNYTFKDLTTIGCGGNIDILYSPNNVSSLKQAFKYLNENEIKYFVLGNGSNVLASDHDYKGVVISLRKMPFDFTINGDEMVCSAFYPTSKLAYDLSLLEYGDLSFLGGIPGLLGGAIYNNSGAYNDSIKNHILEVKYINTAGEIVTIDANDCAFDYRRSVFHYLSGIIVEAKLKIKKIPTKSVLEKRAMQRRLDQPLECKSMGSIFKNNQLISAWKVIDALGMRGFHISDAAISAKHANFIINLGNAKCKDIRNLILLIKKRAELEFGIKLICEISVVE